VLGADNAFGKTTPNGSQNAYTPPNTAQWPFREGWPPSDATEACAAPRTDHCRRDPHPLPEFPRPRCNRRPGEAYGAWLNRRGEAAPFFPIWLGWWGFPQIERPYYRLLEELQGNKEPVGVYAYSR